jgi:hypothetical protein
MAKKNQKKNAGKVKDKRNLKYGSLSVAITVVFVALVIILNIIVTSLSAVHGWYTDMTASGYYSISDEFTAEMDKLVHPESGEKVYINIVLLAEEDVFRNYNDMTRMLYQTFKELTSHYDNINMVAYNTTVHPEVVEKYKTTALETFALDDIIFELCDENGNALLNIPAKKYTARSFFMINSDTGAYTGYNAETKILSAVALLTGKANKPTAYYLQGHSEPTLEEAGDWSEVLELAGFNVKAINLSTEDFGETSGDDIVVINCPKFDLIHNTSISEINKLRVFLGTNQGNMIVVEDSETPKLPALEGFISEYGLGFGGSVMDNQHSVSSSGASKLFADYTQTYNPNADSKTMATQILGKLFGSKTSNLPTTIFSTPKEVKIFDSNEVVAGNNSSKSTFALLQSYATAQTTGKGNEIITGSVPLLGVSRIVWDVNTDQISYVIALGSSDFLSSEYESSCANRNIMLELLRLMWDNTVYYDNIDYKSFDDTALTNVSTAAANAWTITCVALIPAAIAVCGVVVYVRRRHS